MKPLDLEPERESNCFERAGMPVHPLIRRGTAGIGADETGVAVPGLSIGGSRGLAWLARGSTHEFLSGEGEEAPAIAWLVAVTAAVMREPRAGASGTVVWVGKRVWPTPWVLAACGLGCGSMVMVDVDDVEERMWAADQCLRAGLVVVADASGFAMAASRRLVLAAEAGGSMGLFARPACDEKVLTAACSRWRVRPAVTAHANPAWRVERLRCRASPLSVDEPPAWVLEWVMDCVDGLVDGGPRMTFREVGDEEQRAMGGVSGGAALEAGDGGVVGGVVDRPCAAAASQRVA